MNPQLVRESLLLLCMHHPILLVHNIYSNTHVNYVYIHAALDGTSTLQFLMFLTRLADTNRTVVLSIHQPRFEVFHMFHRLVLICEGQV